jgi:hydrogenase maturation protease
MTDWDPSADRRRLECLHIGSVEVRPGNRVRLRPRNRADILDLALAGKTATIDAIEQDFEGRAYVAVTVDDDPGQDLGALRQPGHRFFFFPEEIEPLDQPRILIACIGNIFLGDDAFGVEVAQRLRRRALPPEVRVVDFGIRGLDLAYALLEPFNAVILVDATARGSRPGTLYVLEPDSADQKTITPSIPDPHNLDPARVMQLAAELGGPRQRFIVVGCEPESLGSEDSSGGISPVVSRAADEAVPLIEDLIARLLDTSVPAHDSATGQDQAEE